MADVRRKKKAHGTPDIPESDSEALAALSETTRRVQQPDWQHGSTSLKPL